MAFITLVVNKNQYRMRCVPQFTWNISSYQDIIIIVSGKINIRDKQTIIVDTISPL
jgi:hypothetical protein